MAGATGPTGATGAVGPTDPHDYAKAGFGNQKASTFVRPLNSGTTVQWGYQNYAALTYWAHDTYTAMEITRIK